MSEVDRLYVTFDADGKPYIKGLRQAERETTQTAGKLEKTLGTAGQAAGLALAAGLAVASTALVSIGTSVIKTAANFEYEMSRIRANANATTEEMEALRGTVLQLGKDTAFSAAQSAQAANELVKAGLSVSETMAALPGMLALAAAGELDVAKAAEITANQLSVFRLKAADANKVADVLALTANRSTTEVNLLGESLAMVGSVAAQAGLTIDETAAALGILANNGLKGSDAGTSLKQMFMQLMGPSEKARRLMEQYGISVYDASGNMLDMEEILRVVGQGLEGTTNQERDFALATIFGSDAVRAANILLKDGADAFAQFRAEISKTGAAQEIAATKMDNLLGSWEQLKGSAETLAIILGEKALPKVREFVDDLTEALNVAIETGDWGEAGGRIGELIGDGIRTATPYIVEAVKVAVSAGLRAAGEVVAADIFNMPTGPDFTRQRDYLAQRMADAYKDLPKNEAFQKALADIQSNWFSAAFTKQKDFNIPKVKTADEILALGRALGVVFTEADLQQMGKLGVSPERLASYRAEQLAKANAELQREIEGQPAWTPSGLWQPGADSPMVATLKAAGEAATEAADAQRDLGAAVGPTTEELEAQAAALEAQEKQLEGYADALSRVLESEVNPSRIWEEAEGSLTEYLKKMDEALASWDKFDENMRSVIKQFPSYTEELITLAGEQGAPFIAALAGADSATIAKVLAQQRRLMEQDLTRHAENYRDMGNDAWNRYAEGWAREYALLETRMENDYYQEGREAARDFKRGWGVPRLATDVSVRRGGLSQLDAGGYIQPGINVVANWTGKPEPVLTHTQWEAVQSLIAGVVKPSMDTAQPPAGSADLGVKLDRLIATTAGLAVAFDRSLQAQESTRWANDRERRR